MQTKMARTRALLTERDRELINDEDAGNRRYQAISEVRSRIRDNMKEDVEILKANHPALLEELRDVVCE